MIGKKQIDKMYIIEYTLLLSKSVQTQNLENACSYTVLDKLKAQLVLFS